MADEMVVKRIKEFDRRHGTVRYHVEEGSTWLLFADGAQRQDFIDFGTPLVEPPACPYERAQLVARFYAIVYQRARSKFLEFKGQLKAQARMGAEWMSRMPVPAAPRADAFEELKRLQKEVQDAYAVLEEKQAAVEAAKPAEMVSRERANAINRQENEQALAALEAIRI